MKKFFKASSPDKVVIEKSPFDKKQAIKSAYLEIFGSFDTEVHGGKFFIHLFNEVPFSYTVYAGVETQKFLKLLTEKYELDSESFLVKEEQGKNKKYSEIDYKSSSYFIKLDDQILLELYNYKAIFWYGRKIEFSRIQEVTALLKKVEKKKKHKKKFYMVSSTRRTEAGLEFKKFSIKKTNIDLNLNYNDDFQPIHETVSAFLNDKKKNGLVLLHGKYGTGKTSYIRHIMNVVNKRFIFLPLDMMDVISSPSFIPFIANHKDSILVLEDCENLLMPRANGNSSNALVNLLNLGDGLLSDALSIKLICTFNTDLTKIDQAILSKGRLVARYEFKALEVSKAKALAENIGLEDTITQAHTLAELYNKNKENFNEESIGKKMGF